MDTTLQARCTMILQDYWDRRDKKIGQKPFPANSTETFWLKYHSAKERREKSMNDQHKSYAQPVICPLMTQKFPMKITSHVERISVPRNTIRNWNFPGTKARIIFFAFNFQRNFYLYTIWCERKNPHHFPDVYAFGEWKFTLACIPQ